MPPAKHPGHADLRKPRESDPYGQAALLLIDSLIHALVDDGSLANEQAVEVVRDAAVVHAEGKAEGADAQRRRKDSLATLCRIASSLEADAKKPVSL
ncbi:hypothetical protein [Sphingomonas bacterium]|uniref:hypothetical protein n=1 Tax=Sphingomonas bacterium TaxID=1895847 RepID=UPI0015765110|nr:hypothetical protein [Sphingomonas bacterium]